MLLDTSEINRRHKQDVVNQQNFEAQIGNLRPTDTHQLPDLAEALNQDARRTEGLTDHFNGTGSRLYIADGAFSRDGLASPPPNRLSFDPKQLLRMGKEASQHMVFMGLLRGRWFHDRSERSVEVAVKPIVEDVIKKERLLHEVAMYQFLGRVGLASLNVVGVLMHSKPRDGVAGHVITRFDRDLFTMDAMPWEKLSTDEKWGEVGRAVNTLVALHSELLFHGDAEFKNIGFGTVDQSYKLVDLELGVNARGVSNDAARIAKQMSSDLSALSLSVDRFVIPNLPPAERPVTELDRFKVLLEHVYEPYIEKIMRGGSPYIGVLLEAYSLVMEQKAKQATGDW